MKLNTPFLFATLRWRGFKNSPRELAILLSRIPAELTSSEYQSVLEAHFLIPKSIGAMWFECCVREFQWLVENGCGMSTYFDVGFPSFLRHLEEPPMILCWWGDILKPQDEFISVVGSRNPSRDTLAWMEQHLDIFLRRSGATTVSGGARGIDQKAHMLSLRSGLPTICLVPAGLSRLYPTMLSDWKTLILESGGAIVSPFSPFSEMEKRFFVERNRYIACWSKITFVLEAKRRSGTMMTARWAKHLDRDIAVLPCAPNNCGLGGLDLIVDDGGIPIRDYQDILAAFNRARIKSLPAFEGDVFQP